MQIDPTGVAADMTADIASADAQGRAALVLVESLIHGLIEHKVLSLTQVIEIVDLATQSADGLQMPGDASATMEKSTQLIRSIGDSLKIDLPK